MTGRSSKGLGEWERQDPGFPDTVFRGVTPTPGFEIKAWFPSPLRSPPASKTHRTYFTDGNTYVCMLAWLLEHHLWEALHP